MVNLYFRYRYNAGIADANLPNYVDLGSQALTLMDAVDASQNPYWEDPGLLHG